MVVVDNIIFNESDIELYIDDIEQWKEKYEINNSQNFCEGLSEDLIFNLDSDLSHSDTS